MNELLPALAGAWGDRPDAICIDGVTSSWADLDARARAVAGRISGARAVAVAGTSTMDTVVAVVAALLAGVPVVPVPADAGPIERDHILRDSAAEVLLSGAAWDVPATITRFDVDHLGTSQPSQPLPTPAADAPAVVMYTSGTTGLPKGAVLSRRALAADLDALAEAWAWTPDDHLVHGLPLFHVHGLVLGVLGALRVGSRLTHTGRPTPAAYAAAAGSLYFGVPTVWTRVCADEAAATSLASARLLVSGSAPLPTTVFERLVALCGQAPIERYGMTETLITLSTRFDGERRPGWVGTTVTGVETTLRDDEGSSVDHDGETIGGLLVRGATMFDGYLSGGSGAEWTSDGWFVTGDSAVIGPDGFHRIVGRSSVDIIKTGGFKVGAGEVEAVLLDHPGVAEVAVVGIPDDDLGQRVVAFVVAAGGQTDSVSERDLMAYAGERLTTHKRPRAIVLVDELPRNAMGKVVKATLLRET